MKKPSNDTLIFIISTILTFTGYLFGFLFTQWYHQTIHHFDQYRQTITVFLGAILAAILTITIFYMGKFHDYQREFTTQNGKFEEAIGQLKISLDIFQATIFELQMKIKLIKNTPSLEKTNKKLEELNDIKMLSEAIDKAEKFKQTNLEIADEYKTFPKTMIRSLMTDVLPFLGGFVYMVSINFEPTLGKFLFLLIILAVAIYSFLHSWYFSERKMRLLHRYYEISTGAVTFTRTSRYQIDSLKLQAENLVEILLLKEKGAISTEKENQTS